MSIAPDKTDWRWHKVTELLDYSHAKAVTLAKNLDPLTQKVYKFRRQFKDRLLPSLPDFVNAHEVWLQRPYQRAVLEGLILGGAPDDIIVTEMEIGADDIAAYIAMFFDVRGRRRMDVSNMVFQGMPNKGYHPQDRLGVMHRLGWFGGFKLLQAILSQGLNTNDMQVMCANVCKDIVRRQLPEFGMAAGMQAEFIPDFLKIANDWDSGQSKSSGSDAEDAIKGLMDGIGGLDIADGSVKANLLLPAAEPCFADTIEVTHA